MTRVQEIYEQCSRLASEAAFAHTLSLLAMHSNQEEYSFLRRVHASIAEEHAKLAAELREM